MVLTIVQILIFIVYVTFILIKFGLLSSISESWYSLRDIGGVWYSLFTWFCWGIGFTMFFQTNGVAPYLFFLSGVGFCSVGVATMFKLNDSIQPYIHFTGALTGIICSLIGLGIERHGWIPLIIFTLSSIILKYITVSNKIWWIEIMAFITIGLGLLYY